MIYWLTSLAALLGVWLNIHGRASCFLIWMGTNAIWAVADWQHGLPAQSALQAVYWGLSVYGYITWRRTPRPARE